MNSRKEDQLAKYNEKGIKIEEAEWELWCRLCAKEDKDGNISIFSNNSSSELSLSAAIGKYFWVNVRNDEALPKRMCPECFSLVTGLVNFSERVTKVQQMYTVLLNTNDSKSSDLQAIREKYGLVDEGTQHFMIQQRRLEIHYYESKPKLTDCVEDEQMQEINDDINPLESAGTNLSIKKELCLNDTEKVVDTNDVNSENESLDNDQMQDSLMSYEVNNLDDSNDANDLLSIEKSTTQDLEENDNLIIWDRVEKTKSKFKKVLSLDDTKNNFSCFKCPRKFKRELTLKRHLDRYHGDYPCSQCKRVFNRKDNLDRHTFVHLPLASRKVVPCPHCSKKFMANTLQPHIRYMHTQEPPKNPQLICEECGITVPSTSALKEHLLTHTDYAPFECEVCKKGFKSQARLKLHMEIHDPNKHICAECGLQLNSRVTLNRHLLVHSDEMRHKCDYCGRAFKRSKALKNHLILHTGLKPYSCDFCDRTFASGPNCRTHKKKSHPEELALLEAAGRAKSYTKNLPKLETLKAVTKTVDNLVPVVTKRSGNFSFKTKETAEEPTK